MKKHLSSEWGRGGEYDKMVSIKDLQSEVLV